MDDQKILIYDCRTQTIKNILKKDLNFMAPELYLYIQQTDDPQLNNTVNYIYYLKNNKLLTWHIGNLYSEDCRIPLEIREKTFLAEKGIMYNDITLVERYWYLNVEEINKRLE
jgi:hypothetical protein